MIHPRVILVTADYVATSRGVSLEAIYDLVDGRRGEETFLYVFNVASNLNARRELRFWSKEVLTPDWARSLKWEEAIKQIIPRREALPCQFVGLRNWEVGELLRISNATLIELREELEAVSHNGGIYIPRAALENFFRRRWCNAADTKLLQTKLI